MATVSVNPYTPLRPGGMYRRVKEYFPNDTITNVSRSMYVNGNPVELYEVYVNSYKYGTVRYDVHLFFMRWETLASFDINKFLNKPFVQFMYTTSMADSPIAVPDTAARIQQVLENNPNSVFRDETVIIAGDLTRRLKDKGFFVNRSGGTLWVSGSYDGDYIGFNLSQSENLIMIDTYTSFDDPLHWTPDELVNTVSSSLNLVDVYKTMKGSLDDFLDEIPATQKIFGPELIYTLHNDWSDIPQYRQAKRIGANEPEQYEINSGSVYDGDMLVRQFITQTGSMANVPYVPAGQWDFDLYGKVDTIEGVSSWKIGVYKRDVGGAETLFFTASSADYDNFFPTRLEWSHTTNETQSIAPTDRLVFKVYAFTDSTGSRTFVTYFEGKRKIEIKTPVREQTVFGD